MPVVINTLGKSDYGIWILVGQLVQLLNLTDLGVTNLTGRLIARFRATDDARSLREVTGGIIRLLSISAVAIAAIALALAPHVPRLVQINGTPQEVSSYIFLVCASSLAASLPLRFSTGILAGHNRYDIIDAGRLLATCGHLVAIIIMSRIGSLNLKTLSWLTAVETVLLQLGLAFCATRIQTVGWVSPWRREVKPHIKEVTSLSGSALMNTLNAMLYRQALLVAVGIYLDASAGAVYGVVLTIVTNLQALLLQLNRPMLTLASAMHATAKLDKLAKSHILVQRCSLLLAVAALGGAVFFGDSFLRLLLQNSGWTEDDYAVSTKALCIMTGALVIGVPQISSRSVLQGVGRHWHVSIRLFVSNLVSLLAGLAMMAGGMGLLGAALGWSLAWFIQGTLLYMPLMRQVLSIPIWTTLRQAYLPGLLAGAAMFLVAGAARHAITPTRWIEFGSAVVVVAIACLVTLRFLMRLPIKIESLATPPYAVVTTDTTNEDLP